MATQKTFAPELDASKHHNTWRVDPSKVRADHRNNSSRAPIYATLEQVPEIADYAEMSDAFCFTREQVEQRLASLMDKGQMVPVRVYMTATGQAVLMEGFLRHAAFLLAHARNWLDRIPGCSGKIMVQRVPAPKDGDGRVRNLWANAEENDERLDRTPLDTAHLFKRALVMGQTKEEISREAKVSIRVIDRHLSLLALPVADQLDLHEGRIGMTALLDKAKKQGEGTSRAPRSGVKHSVIKNAFARMADQDYAADLRASEVLYTVDDVLAILAHVGGVDLGDAEVPEAIADMLANVPAAPPKKRGRPTKVATLETPAEPEAANDTPKPRPPKAPKKRGTKGAA